MEDQGRSAEDHAALRDVAGALAGVIGTSLTFAVVVDAPLAAKLALAGMTFLALVGTLVLSVLELRARRRARSSRVASASDVGTEDRGETDAAPAEARAWGRLSKRGKTANKASTNAG